MNLEELRARLRAIDAISNEQWMAGIAERKRKELQFHDANRNRELAASLDSDTYERFYGNKKFYRATGPSRAFVDDWLVRNAKGKVFLDFACGDGGVSIRAAKAGAALAIGIDLSRVSVENARADAARGGVADNTFFVQSDAENTGLPDNSVDVVICSGVLHHMDLSYAFPELRRVLVPGGRILGVEALDYNPAIKLYRNLTPDMRTEWEKAHILDLGDIRFAKRFFDVVEVRYWHITSILGAYMPSLMPAFHALDGLLTRIPLVRLMSWVFTFELRKPT